jgi:pectate lyase
VGGANNSAGASGATSLGALQGWAATSDCGPDGTTGGALGPTVRPTTALELDDAVRAPQASTIELSGRFELGDIVLQITGDKTLIGVSGAEIVGSARLKDAANVILRNIKFNGANVDGLDALEVDGSTCVWIDHCEFFDGGDSNLDIVRGSDLVTVSWSKFYYVEKTDDHRLGSVCGNNDTDTPGRINVTFHHNYWGNGVLLNMPSVRHGKVHIFNSYFGAAGNDYGISAGYMARLLIENNVFDGVKDPIVFGTDQDTAEVVERGNDYSTATGAHVSRGTSFEPPYAYELDELATVVQSVPSDAGVR